MRLCFGKIDVRRGKTRSFSGSGKDGVPETCKTDETDFTRKDREEYGVRSPELNIH